MEGEAKEKEEKEEKVDDLSGCSTPDLLFIFLFLKLWMCKSIRKSEARAGDYLTQRVQEEQVFI